MDGDGKMEYSEFCKLMEALLPVIKEKPLRKVTMAMALVMVTAVANTKLLLHQKIKIAILFNTEKESPPLAIGVRDLVSRVG